MNDVEIDRSLMAKPAKQLLETLTILINQNKNTFTEKDLTIFSQVTSIETNLIHSQKEQKEIEQSMLKIVECLGNLIRTIGASSQR